MGFNIPLFYEYSLLLSTYRTSNCLSFGRARVPSDAKLLALQLLHDRGKSRVDIASLLSFPNKSWWSEEYFLNAYDSKLLSIDISSDESPDAIVNLANPYAICEEFPRGLSYFDIVIDLGTSEHIHSLLSSFYNAFLALKLGGCYIMSVPVTGWLGHGLYRFNPQYFLSVSLPGYFEIEKLYFLNTSREFSFAELRENHHISEPDDRFNLLSWAIFRKTSDALSWKHLKDSAIELCYR